MQNRFTSVLKYFVYWLLFFQAGRLVFFFITKAHSSQFSFTILAQSMVHALWLDVSMAGYFTLFFCLMLIGGVFNPKIFGLIFKWSHWLFLGLCSLFTIGNAVLYSYWSVPLDFTALKYLETPAEAAASIDWWLVFIPLLVGVGLFIGFRYLFLRFGFSVFQPKPKIWYSYIVQSLVLLLCAGLCIIPIRGGVGIVPVNLSYVYFHKDIYPNHAAYNPIWNVLYSLSESGKRNNYVFMNDEVADKKFKSLFQVPDSVKGNMQLLDVAKPNIVVIVLESYLSKLVDLKYKGEEVIPYFNGLTKSEIYFSNLYSSGDRSDKGLVSIFSGYPAMPKSALVQYPDKFSKIPSIFRDVIKADYTTSFYYGGNLDFANLRSFFISSGVQKIVSGKDMPESDKRGKWGVHDEYMLAHLFNDLQKSKQPFFSGIFTLSNHEPYDLPIKKYFGNKHDDEDYMSAARYTDDCLAKFLEDFKKSPLWKNTLIVLVADHGVPRLGIKEFMVPEKFHIPMVWTGGAIADKKLISKVCSQTDLPLLILNQCCIKPNEPYRFSNEIDKIGAKPFAAYFLNDGFGFISQNHTSVFDNVSRQYWTNTCPEDSNGIYGKAYLQVLSKDFEK